MPLVRALALVVCSAAVTTALAAPPAQVTVAGVAYTGAPAAENRGGVIWGPVAPIVSLLGATVTGDERHCEITTVTGAHFSLGVGERSLRRDDGTTVREAPPVVNG